MKKLVTILLLNTLISSGAMAQRLAIDDSFLDGGRDNGPDAYDANWWTTSAESAIEVTQGSLGLISGTSGRGIRTTFSPQPLEKGKTVRVSFTFTTPETIGVNKYSSFRIGMYNKLGRDGLEADLSAYSKRPNILYNGLPGYMIDLDVNLADSSKANIEISKHLDTNIGRLLSTNKGYERLGGGGEPYVFDALTTYTGTIELKKISDGIEISIALLNDSGNMLTKYSFLDKKATMKNIGMLAFHVNSDTFGSTNQRDEPDNGIEFKNVKIEISVARRNYR